MTTIATINPSLPQRIFTDLFAGYTPFEKVFYPALIGLQLVIAFIYPDSPMGTIAALTGVICVALVGKGRISNYFFGAVSNILYFILSLQAVFYGEVMIAAFYVLAQFWGLYTWRKNMTREPTEGDAKDVRARRLSLGGWAAVLIGLGAAAWSYGMLLERIGSNQPYIDGFTTVVAIIAQMLMVYRFREQWLLWIVLNLAQITLWLTSDEAGAMNIVIMYVAFLLNSAYGWYNWTKLSKV